MTKAELLKTEHQIQLKWLDNQIAKINDQGAKSFLNAPVAKRAYEKMKETLIIDDTEIEHFVSVHLSETGIRRIVTALRVYLKRNNANRLQVEITQTNKIKLDQLAKMSGKTKIELINILIATADISEFKKPEEQLELQCN